MIKDPKAKSYKWQLVKSIPGCHKFYREETSGRHSICDYSGSLPHLTDDGVLWIDRERPMVHSDSKWGMPLLNYKEEKTSSLASDEEARWLIETFKLDVEIGGHLFYAGGKISMIPRKEGVGDVSISHITQKDSDNLDKGKVPYVLGNYEYGHMVLTHPREHLSRSEEIRATGMSEAYIRLLNLAHLQGYYYLMIDRDGPIVEGLNFFNW